jgi:hypothetical protein
MRLISRKRNTLKKTAIALLLVLGSFLSPYTHVGVLAASDLSINGPDSHAVSEGTTLIHVPFRGDGIASVSLAVTGYGLDASWSDVTWRLYPEVCDAYFYVTISSGFTEGIVYFQLNDDNRVILEKGINFVHATSETNGASSEQVTNMESFNSKLNELKQEFPHHSFWRDTFPKSPFNTAKECYGFAMLLSDRVFGSCRNSNQENWPIISTSSSMDGLKPGDVVRGNDHTVFVTGVSSDGQYVTYVDCNYRQIAGEQDNHGGSAYCIIHWDRTVTKSRLYNICGASNFEVLRALNNNIGTSSSNNTNEEVSIPDGVYMIYSKADRNLFINNSNGIDADGNALILYPDDQTISGQWYVSGLGNGNYRIYWMGSSENRVMDMNMTKGNVDLYGIYTYVNDNTWTFILESDGYYSLRRTADLNKVVTASKLEAWAPLLISDNQSNDTQRWQLVPIY